MPMAFVVAFGHPVYDEIVFPTASSAKPSAAERVLSGCSTNGCLVLARLGHKTALVGRVGANCYARFVADMQRYAIVPYVAAAEQTAGFRLTYDSHSNRAMEVLGNAGAIDHVPEACARADAVILGPILHELSYPHIEQIRQHTAAPFFLDPQGLLRRLNARGYIEYYINPDIAAIASLCVVVKANEHETHILTGVDPRRNRAEAARRLRSLGCRIAVVTLGDAGAVIDDGECQYHIPAFSTRVADPTGAGDSFMAGLLHAYLHTPDDLFTAGCTGAAVASLWIEQRGPDVPLPLNEIARRTEVLLHRGETRSQ